MVLLSPPSGRGLRHCPGDRCDHIRMAYQIAKVSRPAGHGSADSCAIAERKCRKGCSADLAVLEAMIAQLIQATLGFVLFFDFASLRQRG